MPALVSRLIVIRRRLYGRAVGEPIMQTPGPHSSANRCSQPPQAGAPKPKLLDQVRQAIRARHYSKRTEKSYVDWIKPFIFFHGKRRPLEMGEAEINQFLTDLATNKKVSASTQNQALSAILFLYQHVLKKELSGSILPCAPRNPNGSRLC